MRRPPLRHLPVVDRCSPKPGLGPGDQGEAPALAKAGHRDPLSVDLVTPCERLASREDVRNLTRDATPQQVDHHSAEAHDPGTVRIEVRGQGNVPSIGEPPGDPADIVVEAEGLVQHDDPRGWVRAVGQEQLRAQQPAIRNDHIDLPTRHRHLRNGPPKPPVVEIERREPSSTSQPDVFEIGGGQTRDAGHGADKRRARPRTVSRSSTGAPLTAAGVFFEATGALVDLRPAHEPHSPRRSGLQRMNVP